MADVTTMSVGSQETIDDLLVRPDIQASLATIMKELPKLAVLMQFLGKGLDVSKEVLTDGELLGGLEDLVRSTVLSKYEGMFSAYQEAKVRAERNKNHIGIFGMLRLLNDPTVQKNLRFAQALCEVFSERDRHRDKSDPPTRYKQ